MKKLSQMSCQELRYVASTTESPRLRDGALYEELSRYEERGLSSLATISRFDLRLGENENLFDLREKVSALEEDVEAEVSSREDAEEEAAESQKSIRDAIDALSRGETTKAKEILESA